MRKVMMIAVLLVSVLATGCTRQDRRKVTRAVESATRSEESDMARTDRELKEALEDLHDEVEVTKAKADALSNACDDARREFGRLCDKIENETR